MRTHNLMLRLGGTERNSEHNAWAGACAAGITDFSRVTINMRILGDTLMLVTVGALLGGSTGVACIFLMLLPHLLDRSAWVSLLFIGSWAAMLGAILGAPLGPLLGWFVLRDVRVSRAAWLLPIGTLAGGFLALAIGWLVADVDDGKGTIYLSVGGIIGVVVTAFLLRMRPSEAPDALRLGALIRA